MQIHLPRQKIPLVPGTYLVRTWYTWVGTEVAALLFRSSPLVFFFSLFFGFSCIRSHLRKLKSFAIAIGVSEELSKKIKQIQDLLSQKTSRPVSMEEALEEMTAEYLGCHDPIEKAKQQGCFA